MNLRLLLLDAKSNPKCKIKMTQLGLNIFGISNFFLIFLIFETEKQITEK
jgi:hypothetical protein